MNFAFYPEKPVVFSHLTPPFPDTKVPLHVASPFSQVSLMTTASHGELCAQHRHIHLFKACKLSSS